MNAWRTILTHFSLKNQNMIPENLAMGNLELETYFKNNVVFAFDHLKFNISKLDDLPLAKNAMAYLYNREEEKNNDTIKQNIVDKNKKKSKVFQDKTKVQIK